MSTDRNRKTARRFFEAFNSHDVEAALELFGEEAVALVVPEEMGIGQDREALAQYLAMNFEAFPDMHLEVLDMAAEGDLVAARVRGTGTHEGEFMGIRPQGRAVEEDYGEFFRFDDDGKIVRMWGYYDSLSFMQQLGILPKGGDRAVRALSAVLAAVRGRDLRKRRRAAAEDNP
jgi:steroid delta-isomerase-like uncharacterized protein